MEALPKLYMLYCELKVSPSNTDFSGPLKKYIWSHYQEDADSYDKELSDLNSLRQAACKVPHDFSGCSILKRYYSQLILLQNRFPMTDDGPACVAFTWTDIYSGSTFSITDIKYEQACMLYNIGALHSKLGALDTRCNPEGMKMTCTHFQCAAWAFQHLRDTYPQPKGSDMSHDILTFMMDVMLAQAQECILEKSMLDNRKSSITAKVAAQVVDYYRSGLLLLSGSGSSNKSSLQDIVGSKMFKMWKRYIDFKMAYYTSISNFYMGNQCEEQQKMGERAAWYQSASENLKEAVKIAKTMDRPDVDESLLFLTDVVGGKYASAKKENDFVYHEKVPPIESLQDVKGASLVKGIPFDPSDSDVYGADIFARLVPMETHSLSSLYSEEKAKVLRSVVAKVEERNEELSTYMSSLQLDRNIFNEEQEKIPHELIEKCAALSVKPTTMKELMDLMRELTETSTNVDVAIKSCQSLLSEEDQKEKRYQSMFGKSASSMIVVELNKECSKLEEAHRKAAESNRMLQSAAAAHVSNLQILAGNVEAVTEALPSFSSVKTPENVKAVNEYLRLLNKVKEMQEQRRFLVQQLRDALHNDDITKRLLAYSEKDDAQKVFEEELKKHSQKQTYIDQNLAAQDNILFALTQANANFADILRSMMAVQKERDSIASSLIASYEAYEDLVLKGKQGLEFYQKLQANVSRLLDRIRSVVRVQDEERTQRAGSQKPIGKKSVEPQVVMDPKSSTPKLKDYLPYMTNQVRMIPPIVNNAVAPHQEIPFNASSSIPQQASANQVFPRLPHASGMQQPVYPQKFDSNISSGQATFTPAVGNKNIHFLAHEGVHASHVPAVGSTNYIATTATQSYTPSTAVSSYTAVPSTYISPATHVPSSPTVPSNYTAPVFPANYIPSATPSTYIPATVSSTYISTSSHNYATSVSASVSTGPSVNYIPTVVSTPSHNYVPSTGASMPAGPAMSHIPTTVPILTSSHNYVPAVGGSVSAQPTMSYIPTTLPISTSSLNYVPSVGTSVSTGRTVSYVSTTVPSCYASTTLPLSYTSQTAPSYYSNTSVVSSNSTGSTSLYGSSETALRSAYAVPQNYNFNSQSYGNSNTSQMLYNSVNQSVAGATVHPEQSSLPPHMANTMMPSSHPNLASTQTSMEPKYCVDRNYQYSNYPSQPYVSGDQNTKYSMPTSQFSGTSTSEMPVSIQNMISGSQMANPYLFYNQSKHEVLPSTSQFPYGPLSASSVSSVVFPAAPSNISGNSIAHSVASSGVVPYSQVTSHSVPLNGSVISASNQKQQSIAGMQVYMHQNGGQPPVVSHQEPKTVQQNNVFLSDQTGFNLDVKPLSPTLVKQQEAVREVSVEPEPVVSPPSVPEIQNNQDLVKATFLKAKEVSPKEQDPLDDMVIQAKFLVEMEKFEKLVEGLDKKSLNGTTSLDQKWKDLIDTQEKESRKKSISVARCYPLKNRVPDIMPYDNNRVKLTTSKDDYINASFLKDLSPSCPSFILTQAPLPATYGDFWLMVWEQQIENIVCLLSNTECKGQLYWPEQRGKKIAHGDLELSLQHEKVNLLFTERIISLNHSKNKTSRSVVHLQFTSWPPNGFPNMPDLVKFVSEVLNYHKQQRTLLRPVVVHCSTGVGRSGVFCLISAFASEIKNGISPKDVSQIAAVMCLQRKFIIPDKEHLKFSYDSVFCSAQMHLKERGINWSTPLLASQFSNCVHAPTATNISSCGESSTVSPTTPEQPIISSEESSSSACTAEITTSELKEEPVIACEPVYPEESKSIVDNVRKDSLSVSLPHPSITAVLDPSKFTLDSPKSTGGKRFTKESFASGTGGLGNKKDDSTDPFSSLDPLWSLR